MSILQNIHGHDSLTALTDEERVQLCAEIREYLVSSVAQTGGHLASNLGTVELTVAIETVFDTMRDRLVFDVGHQSYVHKLLTGRQADFASLRQYGGMSGFPKPHESAADAFVAGHASSSVSIALGMARARTALKENYQVIALMGDGAATGGMAYEGLNDAADSLEPMVIILNDNEMSIDRNVGGLSKHLSHLRMKEQYLGMKRRYRGMLNRIPGGKWIYRVTKNLKDRLKRMLLATTIFENMGLGYLGPVDGHNLPELIQVLKAARDMRFPVVVHVITKKGCGYLPAERDPSRFHGIGKFDPVSGKTMSASAPNFSDSFGETMVELASRNPRVCAVTAAMPGGTGLLDFKKKFPKRLFDVGIAEEHAVSMAGGLAKQGMIPVVAIYSTFLQRSFDQIMQDVALMKLHVVFAVDRAGLVGEDGATHHGSFDVGFLRQIPGLLVLTPASMTEQKEMLRWAVEEYDGPVAVRYPRGGDGSYTCNGWKRNPLEVVRHREGQDITLVTYGTMVNQTMEAAGKLAEAGIEATVLRLLSVSEPDVTEILKLKAQNRNLLIVEEAASASAIAGEIALGVRDADCRVLCRNLGNDFVPHGSTPMLYRHCGLDADALVELVKEVLKNEN